MNDEAVMAERVGQLQQENEELKEQLRDLKWSYNYRRFWTSAVGAVSALAVVVGLFYLIYNGLHSKVTDNCYISSENRQVRVFVVQQTVEWGSDRLLGVSSSMDEALKIAKKQSCRVKSYGTAEKK